MLSLNVVASLLFMVVAVRGQHWSSDRSCDFTGFNPEAAMSRFLAKVPEEANIGNQQFKTLFPGFQVGGLQARGLNHLRQFGPAIPYCVNGSRLLQVDLLSRRSISIKVPWKTCSGKEGSIMLSALVVRFTLQLSLVDSVSGSGGILLRVRDYAPAATEELFVTVLSAGRVVMTTETVVLSKIFDGVLRQAWNDMFYDDVLGILTERSTQ